MRKTLLFVALSVLGIALIASADPGDTLWTRTYGGSSRDHIRAIDQTTDGGCIFAGATQSFGAGEYDIYLIKTDSNGDTIWTKTFGGVDDDKAYSVHQTIDGGYIVGGTSWRPASLLDFIMIKTDSLGNEVGTKYYGGVETEDIGVVIPTSDGGYIMTGQSHSYGGRDVYVVKTNGSGDTLWTKTYGGSLEDSGKDIKQTSDGGYIICGSTESYGAGNDDVYLIKTDANGNMLWSRTYGDYKYDDGFQVLETADNGYIIAASTNSFSSPTPRDCYVIKTDNNGNVVWEKIFGGPKWDEALAISKTPKDDYIITGYKDLHGSSNGDFYIIALDRIGDSLWTRVYGGINEDKAFAVAVLENGNYLVGGHTYSFGAGGRECWLLNIEGVDYNSLRLKYTAPDYTFDIKIDSTITKDFDIIAFDTTGYVKPLCDSSWVSFDPDSIYLNPDDTVTITASFDATGMNDFTTYESVIYFESDAPGLENKIIPVTMTTYPSYVVTIGMIPDNTDPVCPGTFITFTGTLTNPTDNTVYTDVWLVVHDSNATEYGPLESWADIVLPADSTRSWSSVSLWVPNNAVPGDYDLFARTGYYNTLLVVDETSFPFTIVDCPGRNGPNTGWAAYGWGNDTPPIQNPIPTKFSLNFNYPNPFNATTNISFDVAESGRINLNIYNLAGQKVETLVDGVLNAGQHSITWDASKYSSGIYFYKLNAGGKAYTKRMTLLK
ncbi:MAG: T9SS type A sorting domain-containing protein [candidate division Zixibacteria bacterium]|nr:T9SS type A sorting domain-containing protein [candidate division Zixibacteria bacterium]